MNVLVLLQIAPKIYFALQPFRRSDADASAPGYYTISKKSFTLYIGYI